MPGDIPIVCSTTKLAPHIGLYTASVVSLTEVLIGWRASDCDTPTQLLHIQINMGNTVPSLSWRASPMWRKQKAFPLPGTAALWVFWKGREFPAFFRGRGQSYACRHGTWNSLTYPVYSSHKSHNASHKYPTMYHFVTEKNGALRDMTGALWDMGLVHCGICEIGLWSIAVHQQILSK